MRKKKHDLRFHTRKCTFSTYGIQIASIITFYVIFFILKCFIKTDSFIEQVILSLLTETTICYLAYKKAWKVGDYHSGEVLVGAVPLRKRWGVVVGLLAVAPIGVCAVLSSVLHAFGVDLGIFETILNLFVFRWSGVVEYITLWTNGSTVIAVVVYILACVPLVITMTIGFKNGFLGVHEGISLKKKHSPVQVDNGAKEIWEKA